MQFTLRYKVIRVNRKMAANDFRTLEVFGSGVQAVDDDALVPQGRGVFPELLLEGVGAEDDDFTGGEALGGGGTGHYRQAKGAGVLSEAGVIVDDADEFVAGGLPTPFFEEQAAGMTAGAVEVEVARASGDATDAAIQTIHQPHTCGAERFEAHGAHLLFGGFHVAGVEFAGEGDELLLTERKSPQANLGGGDAFLPVSIDYVLVKRDAFCDGALAG
jgi:hypothetical protein